MSKRLVAKDIIAGASPDTASDLAAYDKAHTFDLKKVPADGDSVITLGGEKIGSRENIVTITGKAKSRKTIIAAALMTSILNADGFLGFDSTLESDSNVLHIDTEQGYSHYYYSVKRVLDDADMTAVPENFHSRHIRDADIARSIELIEYLLDKLKPAVFILDGVTDLVSDINDQSEAVEIGKRIQRWTTDYNMLFVNVIHITKSTNFMTGAVGTYLEKKSETVIHVEIDKDDKSVSHVSCQYSRNKPFAPFSIRADINHKYTIDGNYKIEIDSKALVEVLYGQPLHEKLAMKVLGPSRSVKKTKSAELCQKYSQEILGTKLTKNQSYQCVKYYLECHLFNDDGDGNLVPAPAAFKSPESAGLFGKNDDDLPF